MQTSQLVVTTAVVVTVGRWAQKKPFTPNVLIGAAGLAIGLSVMSESDPGLAARFALLILIAAALTYGQDIAKLISNSSKGAAK